PSTRRRGSMPRRGFRSEPPRDKEHRMLDVYEFHPDGRVYGLYSDQVDLRALGHVRAERGSHVEWDDDAQAWYASILASRARLGPFLRRSDAVAIERAVMAARLGA